MFKGKIKGNHIFLKGKWKEITMFKINMKGKDQYVIYKENKWNSYFPKGALRWHTRGS